MPNAIRETTETEYQFIHALTGVEHWRIAEYKARTTLKFEPIRHWTGDRAPWRGGHPYFAELVDALTWIYQQPDTPLIDPSAAPVASTSTAATPASVRYVCSECGDEQGHTSIDCVMSPDGEGPHRWMQDTRIDREFLNAVEIHHEQGAKGW